MSQTNLQVPIDIKTREKAKKLAQRQGFSSLQEMIRVFLSQVVNQNLRIGFVSESLPLSSGAEKRYEKLLSEKVHGKTSSSADELMSELEA
tara:strand:+ start:66 stop:338 length:273 start_codon:yes stop_codon:yes gene_type:complete